MADISETKKILDQINAALESYDPVLKEKARDVLLKQAFGVEANSVKPPASSGKGQVAPVEANPIAFHQLVEKWTPDTQAEWSLLASYYFQEVLGKESLTAFEINKELKQHGAVISNITVSLEENINQNPALMRQIGKAGKTKQAKKKYIVTTNGINFVKDKLNAQKQS